MMPIKETEISLKMRDHASSGSDNRLTLVIMLLSLVVICFVYSFVGRDHHSDHRQKQKEILYTIDTMLIPPKNATSGFEPTPPEKKKEPSLNTKMNQEDQFLLENYYSNGKKKIQKFSDKRLFQSLTEESLLEKYQKAAEKPNSSGCVNWGVVTTTKPPTLSIEKFLSFASKWCLVVVGDNNGPKTYLPDLPISRGSSSSSLENNSFPSLDINYIYLSLDDQLSSLSSVYSIISSLPLNHFSRKNIGYLYAIQHGASQMIYDFDDDYSLISMKKANNIFHNTFFQYHIPPVLSSSLSQENRKMTTKRNERNGKKSMKKTNIKRRHLTESVASSTDLTSTGVASPPPYYLNANELVNYNSTFLNVFPLLGSNIHPSWPRGFPINHLKESDTSSLHQTLAAADTTEGETAAEEGRMSIKFEKNEIKKENIGLIHYVANHFPDVDIIYKMTLTLPLDFPLKGHLPILLPSFSSTSKKQVYAPYNSKSTIFFSSLFWSLYLPLSVNNHLTDIFRAYITERIVYEINRRNSLGSSRSSDITLSNDAVSPVSVSSSTSNYPQFRMIFHSPISIHSHRDLFNENGDSKNASSSSSSDQQDFININNRDFLRSYSKEYQLYLIVNILVNELSQFRFNTKTIPGMLEEIYIYLYEIGLFQKAEVTAVQSWIKQLIGMKYRFPTVFSISSSVEKVSNSTDTTLKPSVAARK
jgi:hypothetical protein